MQKTGTVFLAHFQKYGQGSRGETDFSMLAFLSASAFSHSFLVGSIPEEGSRVTETD